MGSCKWSCSCIASATNSGTNKGVASSYNGPNAVTYGNSKGINQDNNGCCCASYVKSYMVAKEGGNMNNGYESGIDACTISAWMRYWGFKPVIDKVFEGREVPEELKAVLQDGDVMIAMGSTAHVYGHIQIWDAKNKKWRSDVRYSRPGVYTSGPNLWQVFRK